MFYSVSNNTPLGAFNEPYYILHFGKIVDGIFFNGSQCLCNIQTILIYDTVGVVYSLDSLAGESSAAQTYYVKTGIDDRMAASYYIWRDILAAA